MSARRGNGVRFGRRAFVAGALTTAFARGMGRTPYGSSLTIELPFSTDTIDPHSLDDGTSALFGPAIADPLFAWDGAGKPYPTLAASLPEATRDGARVTLRPGLVSARGKPLDGGDVVASLDRARRMGAAPMLAAFGAPKRAAPDPLAVHFANATPAALADSLASPLTAIVPRSFSEDAPDGTGAFRASRSKKGLVLERNERAARGPAFLDSIRVERAPDLATGLRAFESGDADVGWLGAGLHRRRPGAVDFHAAPVAFIVLRTGPEAGSWNAPGVAAGLVAALDPARFEHLGLSPGGGGGSGWGGARADVLVDAGSPYLVEVADVVAAVLSQPGHELTPRPVPRAEFTKRRAEGRFSLAVDVVRRLGPSPVHQMLSLLAAVDPRLAEHPPRVVETDLHAVTRTLPLAILGDLAVTGARMPDVHGLETWDLGGAFREPK